MLSRLYNFIGSVLNNDVFNIRIPLEGDNWKLDLSSFSLKASFKKEVRLLLVPVVSRYGPWGITNPPKKEVVIGAISRKRIIEKEVEFEFVLKNTEYEEQIRKLILDDRAIIMPVYDTFVKCGDNGQVVSRRRILYFSLVPSKAEINSTFAMHRGYWLALCADSK